MCCLLGTVTRSHLFWLDKVSAVISLNRNHCSFFPLVYGCLKATLYLYLFNLLSVILPDKTVNLFVTLDILLANRTRTLSPTWYLGILRLLCWRDLHSCICTFCWDGSLLPDESHVPAPVFYITCSTRFLTAGIIGVSAKENFEWGVPSQDFLRFVIENLRVAGQFTHPIYAMFSRNKVE